MTCLKPTDWSFETWVALLVVIAAALNGLSFKKKTNKKAGRSKPPARPVQKPPIDWTEWT